MLKPGLWPPYMPRTTESHAERAVYEALSKHLPKGWYAWHSVRVRTTAIGDAEADFIIADPKRGALILEVKGGKIEQRDGLWYSNGQRLKYDPRMQALRFQSALKNLLIQARLTTRTGCRYGFSRYFIFRSAERRGCCLVRNRTAGLEVARQGSA